MALIVKGTHKGKIITLKGFDKKHFEWKVKKTIILIAPDYLQLNEKELTKIAKAFGRTTIIFGDYQLNPKTGLFTKFKRRDEYKLSEFEVSDDVRRARARMKRKGKKAEKIYTVKFRGIDMPVKLSQPKQTRAQRDIDTPLPPDINVPR